MKNIAIFQADHALQVHTLNVVHGLVQAGYNVDVFLYRCHNKYENNNSIGASVIDLTPTHTYWRDHQNPITKCIEAFHHFIIRPLSFNDQSYFPKSVFDKSVILTGNKKYSCYIGVEKMGLVWAGLLSKVHSVPYIYYSLELYPTELIYSLLFSRRFINELTYFRLRMLEKKYHQMACATMIQDENRANEINKYNKLIKMTFLHLPVSVENTVTEDSDYIRKLFNIDNNVKIILQFGLFHRMRPIEEIAIAAQNFPSDWLLIFHGPVADKKLVEKVRKIDINKRIIISDKVLPSQDIDKLLMSADIGLCFYGKKNSNDYHAGFSSEKLARYLKCKIPVIAFDYPTFLDSVETTGAGVCISDASYLTQAIETILADFGAFRQRAQNAYFQHFEFNSQFQKVITYIDGI